MGAHEDGTLARRKAHRSQLIDPAIPQRPARPVRVCGMSAAGVAALPAPPSPAPAASLALPDRPSIAILPFANLSGDPEQSYFADGITEDIITELSRFRSLFVIARNSSFA